MFSVLGSAAVCTCGPPAPVRWLDYVTCQATTTVSHLLPGVRGLVWYKVLQYLLLKQKRYNKWHRVYVCRQRVRTQKRLNHLKIKKRWQTAAIILVNFHGISWILFTKTKANVQAYLNKQLIQKIFNLQKIVGTKYTYVIFYVVAILKQFIGLL